MDTVFLKVDACFSSAVRCRRWLSRQLSQKRECSNSVFFSVFRCLRTEVDLAEMGPVTSLSGPAIRVGSAGICIDPRARLQEVVVDLQAHAPQASLDADIAAIEVELEQLTPSAKITGDTPRQPKRAPLPADLARVEFHHEMDATRCTTPGCGCPLKRIGENVNEKLDYTPGVFTVERHIRGKWACAQCQPLMQASVPAQIINKGLPTAGLLAQVLVAKYADHFGRGNWLFAGSLRAGHRAAAVMNLIQSVKLSGHDPYAYLKDVLTRLPTHKNSQINELLPHRWQPKNLNGDVMPHRRQGRRPVLPGCLRSSDRAGLPETETGTPQRSHHRFEDGRTAASAHRACRP
jgi:hypothetical protein